MWGTRLRMCNGRLWWWHRNTLYPQHGHGYGHVQAAPVHVYPAPVIVQAPPVVHYAPPPPPHWRARHHHHGHVRPYRNEDWYRY